MPERTCIGCRKKGAQNTMIRWSYYQEDDSQQGLVRAVLASAPRQGRGAWMHERRSCFVTAHKKESFFRALRINKNALIEGESFFALIHE